MPDIERARRANLYRPISPTIPSLAASSAGAAASSAAEAPGEDDGCGRLTGRRAAVKTSAVSIGSPVV
jgi:hypothetical protein